MNLLARDRHAMPRPGAKRSRPIENDAALALAIEGPKSATRDSSTAAVPLAA